MNIKRWIVGFSIIGLLGGFYFFGQILIVSCALIFSAVKSQFESQSSYISSGQKIRIRKTVMPYDNWSTGTRSEKTDFTLYVKGSKIDETDLKNWLDKKNPGVVEYPTIFDAVELKADDVLIILAKGTNGDSYPLVHLYLDPFTSALQTDVIGLDGKESQYNWFPDSRLPGWVRAVNVDGSQFMIRLSPFQVVSLGHGELLKIEFPLAYLASDQQKEPHISFRIVDLNDGKVAGLLKLDKDCFTLPGFSFDHPKLDALDLLEDDQHVKYKYGPKWWDKNVEWNQQTSTLKLKIDHTLAAPPARVMSIQNEVVKRVPESVPDDTNQAIAASPSIFNESEIDQIPIVTKNCAQQNPNGVVTAQSMPARTENIDAAAFCLQPDWPVDPAIRHKVCGTSARKKIFFKNSVTVNEVTFLYHPLDQKKKAVQIVVPEVETNGKKFIQLEDPETNRPLNIKEAFVLNENQLIFKARSEGPWVVYLLNAQEKEFNLQKIGEFGYPSGPFVLVGKDRFLYDTKSAILIRKNPFGYLDRLTDLISIESDKAVASYIEGDKLHLRVIQFTSDSRMEEQASSALEVSIPCFASDDLPERQMTMAQRQRWFDKYFVWAGDGSNISLKTSCSKGVVTLKS